MLYLEISFQPVLRDVAFLVSASFVNNEFFEKFWDIRYLIQLIHFNYNSQFQNALNKTLKETTEDVMLAREIDTPHYIIQKSVYESSLPVLQQQTLSYKEFREGTLHNVYGESHGLSFHPYYQRTNFGYKSKMIDIDTIILGGRTVFSLSTKVDKTSDCQKSQIIYLIPLEDVLVSDMPVSK